MYRKTLYLTEDQNRRLKQLAAEAGVSRNELIRRALNRHLEKTLLPNDDADRKGRPAEE